MLASYTTLMHLSQLSTLTKLCSYNFSSFSLAFFLVLGAHTGFSSFSLTFFLVLGNSNQPIEVTALYAFEGQQPGDLTFQAGDRIAVISKTDSHFDWWEGKLRGRTGIFPANYVTMN